MPTYNYFLLLLLPIAIIAIFRFIRWRKKSVPVEMFNKAQIMENNGQYEEAVTAYENALSEANKVKSGSRLKSKIIARIKMLHTVIEYNKTMRYVRR